MLQSALGDGNKSLVSFTALSPSLLSRRAARRAHLLNVFLVICRSIPFGRQTSGRH